MSNPLIIKRGEKQINLYPLTPKIQSNIAQKNTLIAATEHKHVDEFKEIVFARNGVGGMLYICTAYSYDNVK